MSVCHICWKYFWQPFLKSTFYSFLLMCCFVMASLFLNLKLYPHVRKFSPQHIPFSTSYLCFHLKTEIFFLLKYSLLGSKSVIIDLKKWRGEEKYIGSFILSLLKNPKQSLAEILTRNQMAFHVTLEKLSLRSPIKNYLSYKRKRRKTLFMQTHPANLFFLNSGN